MPPRRTHRYESKEDAVVRMAGKFLRAVNGDGAMQTDVILLRGALGKRVKMRSEEPTPGWPLGTVSKLGTESMSGNTACSALANVGLVTWRLAPRREAY